MNISAQRAKFFMKKTRFTDQNYRLSDFEKEVWVLCPKCHQQAIAALNDTAKEARLRCVSCGYSKTASKCVEYAEGKYAELKQAAHLYFDAALWLSHSFKGEVFWAYNPKHLQYLEDYISAKLREQKVRTHFTLLEKLPKFYHDAKNREALLKIIKKLKSKTPKL